MRPANLHRRRKQGWSTRGLGNRGGSKTWAQKTGTSGRVVWASFAQRLIAVRTTWQAKARPPWLPSPPSKT